jgi:hypothetical protein
MSDSSLSERRQGVPLQAWVEAANTALAGMRRFGEARRFCGMRLVGVDGTSFNVSNTPTMKAVATKARTARGQPAFYRMPCVLLCDLRLHTPLAVSVSMRGDATESELSQKLFGHLRRDDLLIADRYYGNGRNLARLQSLPEAPAFLVRVRDVNVFQRTKRLSDGSWIGRVLDRTENIWIEVRQVKGTVRRATGKASNVRFWTSLLDDIQYPAQEISRLYAKRWEQEIAFKEIKGKLCRRPILQSHTPATAAQEICALCIAQALIASLRLQVEETLGVGELQVSMEKTLEAARFLGELCAVTKNTLPQKSYRVICQRLFMELEWNASKPRRDRSCPRAVRKPLDDWPCLRINDYQTGVVEFLPDQS